MAVGLAKHISFFKGSGFILIVNHSYWWSVYWCFCAFIVLSRHSAIRRSLHICTFLMEFATVPHLNGSGERVITTRICCDVRGGKQCNLYFCTILVFSHNRPENNKRCNDLCIMYAAQRNELNYLSRKEWCILLLIPFSTAFPPFLICIFYASLYIDKHYFLD